MLEHTFCHVPGVGPGTEQRLWEAGLHTWEQAVACDCLPLATRRATGLQQALRASLAELRAGNLAHFAARLAAREHWRLFPHGRCRVAYLDIETTGLGSPGDIITTIVVYDGRSIRTFVNGQNLPDFGPHIEQYGLLVTYNGKTFDLPFIRRYLAIPVRQPHIDLRYVLGSLGYRGGLKGCERQLGLARGHLQDVDGFFAVLLWQEYRRSGDPRVLETLLAYNTLDVVNLEQLMYRAYNALLGQTPFASETLPVPLAPANPYQGHVDVIDGIRAATGWR